MMVRPLLSKGAPQDFRRPFDGRGRAVANWWGELVFDLLFRDRYEGAPPGQGHDGAVLQGTAATEPLRRLTLRSQFAQRPGRNRACDNPSKLSPSTACGRSGSCRGFRRRRVIEHVAALIGLSSRRGGPGRGCGGPAGRRTRPTVNAHTRVDSAGRQFFQRRSSTAVAGQVRPTRGVWSSAQTRPYRAWPVGVRAKMERRP